MKSRTWLTVLVAVGLAAGTAKMGINLVQSARNSAASNHKMVDVVVAAHTLDPGQLLTDSDLKMISIPANGAASSIFREMKPLVGRATASPVAEGQMMFPDLLAAEGSDGGLAALVPAGMRAITVEVSESSGLAGLVTPGCRVDVIATLRHNDSYISRTIVQDVKVSAIGRGLTRNSAEASKDSQPVHTVTLVVTPEQAEAIELASNSTKPRLVLRSMNDTKLANTDGVKLWSLMNEDPPASPQPQLASAKVEPAPAQPAQKPQYKVRFIRGGQESWVNFDLAQANDPGKN